jgi:L-serine/L-threonine ammonia-lyase
MKSLHIRTPLIESLSLSKKWGRRVLLKLENLQPTGSFKIRGIGLLCQTGKSDGVEHFVSSSGGNAGYAAAYAAKQLGATITVFVPTTTPPDLRQRIELQGAEVKVAGDVWDETHQEALSLSGEIGALYISPFDHPLIWKGHSSLVDEIAEEIDKPDAVVLSVGGGGLLCGVVEGLQRHGWKDVPVIAVETEGTASFSASLRQGKLVTLKEVTGIAKSLGARTVARKAVEWAKRHPIQSVVVTDADAVSACIEFANEHRCLVEPACGASLSVAYNGKPILEEAETVVIVVCGGIGVDLARLRKWQTDHFGKT